MVKRFHNYASRDQIKRARTKSDQTWQLLDKKKKIKLLLLQRLISERMMNKSEECRAVGKAPKKSVPADKRNLVEAKATKAEEVAKTGGSKALYRFKNQQIGKNNPARSN